MKKIHIDVSGKTLRNRKKTIASGLSFDSNPALSAMKRPEYDVFEAFFDNVKKVSHSTMPLHKYRLAKLVHHDYDLSKRWYVVFWAWDISKEEYVRKRLFEPINRKKTIQARLHEADIIIKTVNAQLTAGKVLGKDKIDIDKVNVMKFSVLNGIDFVQQQKDLNKNRKSYTRGFSNLKHKVERWLKHEQRTDFLLKHFDHNDAFSFFDYVRSNVANKTFNNYRNDFAVVINFLMKRNPNLFKVNPISLVNTLPVNSKKHSAYNDKQLAAINKACLDLGYSNLLLFIQFIYYTLARPVELRLLRIDDIDIDNNRIIFRAEISKNRRDEYVGISTQLNRIIVESGILNYPGDCLVFGFKSPDKKGVSKLFFYRRIVKVLKHLKYDELDADHDLYSFKHSGAISLYRATKDIKLVQSQCRHSSVSQTDHYLRDLGLMDNFEQLKNWTGNL